MKKMSLTLDELQVESFTTVASNRSRGTVVAHGDTLACTYDCSNGECDPWSFGIACEPTSEFESGGQNNCTTLQEE